MILLSAIENGMLERLKAAAEAGVLGYVWRALDSLPVDFDSKLAERIGQFPSAWSVFGGLKVVEDFGDGTVKAEGRFVIVTAAENRRNERATRFGGSDAEVGSYQLACDAAALLMGRDLGLPIGALRLQAIDSLFAGQTRAERQISVMGVAFSTAFVFDPRAEIAAGPIGDFTDFHADWDIPPFGGVDANLEEPGVQLPADEQADAVDHVVLPGPPESVT